jgi:hypothetical protein
MRLKPPSIFKSNSGSSIIQATIAAGVAFVVLYAMTSSMINLNKQSNIVNLKLEVSNLNQQITSILSTRTQCTPNMLKNSIVVAAPGTINLLFDEAYDQGNNRTALGFYSDEAGTTLLTTAVPAASGSKLTFDLTNADTSLRSVRLKNVAVVAGSGNSQYTADLEVKYTHNYPGLLGVFKPIEFKHLSLDVNPATGVVTGCQLAPKVRTIGCEALYPSVAAPTRTFFTGIDTPATDACANPVVSGSTYQMDCKKPAYTLGGCSSSDMKMIGTSISNVSIMNNGCSIPTGAATNGVTKLYITCIGNF